MIERIRIQGLFNHLDTDIELSEFLTVITGSNDSGKSSILHSLNWFVNNRPRGSKLLLKTDTKEVTEGMITVVSDGIELAKSRSTGNKTKYFIQDEVYHKADIPEELLDCLEMRPSYSFGNIKLELNFLFQLDAPFLISEPASSGGIVLGKIAGTGPVDSAAKEFETETYRSKRKETLLKEDIEKQEERLEEFECLDDFIQLNKELLDEVNSLIKKEDLKNKLQDLNIKYKTADICLLSINDKLKKYNDIDNISLAIKSVKNSYNTVSAATSHRDNYKVENNDLELLNNKLNLYKSVIKVLHPFVKNTNSLVHEYVDIKNIYLKINDIYSHVDSLNNKLSNYSTVNSLKNKIDELKSKQTSFSLIKKTQMSLLDLIREKNVVINKQLTFTDLQTTVKNHTTTKNKVNDFIETDKYNKEFRCRTKELKSVKEKYSAVNNEIKSLKDKQLVLWESIDQCPLCKTIINKGGINV